MIYVGFQKKQVKKSQKISKKSEGNQLPRKEPTNQDGDRKSHKIQVIVQTDQQWVTHGVKLNPNLNRQEEVTVLDLPNTKSFEWDTCMLHDTFKVISAVI